MKRIDNVDGGYTIIAENGQDLTVLDGEGNPTNRCKEVTILAIGTLNTWIEVAELPVEIPTSAEISTAARIAELKAEIAKLEAE